MSEYVTYTLWRQREERMPHELERQRVIQERLDEQANEARVAQQLTVSTEPEQAKALEPAERDDDRDDERDDDRDDDRDDEYVLVNE